MDRIVEIEKISFEKEYERSLRPTSFDEYIWQQKTKKNLIENKEQITTQKKTFQRPRPTEAAAQME